MRGRPQRGMDAKVPPNRRDPDPNRERFMFVLTNLVGRKVQAKLRNNVTYEGLFHGYAVETDFAITLKCARELPSENRKSGEMIPTLIIPGKDFLQVTAIEVPPAGQEPELAAAENRAFATDAEVTGRQGKGGQERELVAWTPNRTGTEAGEGGLGEGGETAAAGAAGFDQFAVNEERFGVASTYREELYTTKLDPSTIPRGKREEAERIAREIESGRMYSELEGDEGGCYPEGADEEQRFSAARGDPKSGGKSLSVPPAKSSGPKDPLPMIPARSKAGAPAGGYRDPVPLTSENLGQHDTALQAQASNGFGRDHRVDRGMISVQSQQPSTMISDMKGINALNLEAALPKLNDQARNDWINFKQSQSRTTGKSGQGSGLKKEFEQSLAIINKRQEAKRAAEAANSGGMEGKSQAAGSGSRQNSGPSGGGTTPSGGSTSAQAKNFAFNPKASSFSLNPQASAWTPAGAGGNSGAGASSGATGPGNMAGSGMSGSQQKNQPMVQFSVYDSVDQNLVKQSLDHVLKGFFDRVCSHKPETSSPAWEEANNQHVSYKDALGTPNQNMPIPSMPNVPQGGMAAPWQGQQQGQQQQGPGGGQMPPGGGPGMVPGGRGMPQMMQQAAIAFVAGPGGGPGYQQMMYPAGPVPMQNAPNGGMGNQGQPQPGMNFGQQGMGQDKQQVGMMGQGNIGHGGGQGNPNMGMGGPQPKMGMGQNMPAGVVPVMFTAGQYQQGFIPQQGMQGQPQQGMQGQPQQGMYHHRDG